MAERARSFREDAPTTATAAAKFILDVKDTRSRIPVGEDAHRLDEPVRQTPERTYDAEFYLKLLTRSIGGLGDTSTPS